MTPHSSDHDDELSPRERASFEQLPQELPVSPQLERRLIGALAERHLIGQGARRPAWMRRSTMIALAAAASLVLVVTGYQLGRRGESAPVDSATYALLLYDGGDFQPETDANYARRYADYSTWIAGLRTKHQFVTGLVFDSAGKAVSASTSVDELGPHPTAGSIASMFLVAAASDAEALAIARSMPHIGYGGLVAVRRIVPVRTPVSETLQ